MLEHYHILEAYKNAGIEPLLEHARDYWSCKRTIPVLKAPTQHADPMTITYTNHLLKDFIDHPEEHKKPIEVMFKYGLRGYSRGGKNGIFFQRKQDTGLESATERALLASQEEVQSDLEVSADELAELRKIKVVWHNPRRLVGVYNTHNNRGILLDWAEY